MEILAPAGTKESFIAAIKAGADSVYVGTKKFNARLNADNLNFYDLEVLIDYARQRNVKVFVVFNTLIKHEEMNDAVNTIAAIDRLNPDGIIVQDLGIAKIISEYFPNLKLHASTQLAVHNSLGVETLANLGFSRVVLARELTFAEIKTISNHPKIELEIFAHGALCFSISGMCFFSSLIGGYSGNRGLCTQPCRRIWHTKQTKGYLFSPKDFELAEFIDKLKTTGVKSLKIEGRMRSSEYVYKVVKAYRMLLDAKSDDFQEVLKDARLILDTDFARKKSSCLFSGRDETLFEPNKAQCMGKEIGKITAISADKIKIETIADVEILLGDRLRISNPETDTTSVFKLVDFEKNENIYNVSQSVEGFISGNPVFKASSSDWDEKTIKKELDEIYNNYSNREQKTSKIVEPFKNTYTSLIARLWSKTDNEKDKIWLKIDNPDWLANFPVILNEMKNLDSSANLRMTNNNSQNPNKNIVVSNLSCPFLILSFNKTNFNGFKNQLENLENTIFQIQQIAIELPPFIAQREIQDSKNMVEYFLANGIEKFVLNNISQLGLFPASDNKNVQKIAGNYLYTWNGYSSRALKEHGFEYFFTSFEDDFLNIRRMANCGLDSRLLIPVFGYPVITRSRMLPKETDYGTVVSDKNDISLKQMVECGINILITEKPVMLFNAIDKLKITGIKNFVIDLSFVKPNSRVLDKIMQHFKDGKNFDDSIKFNFKKGVK